MTVPNLPAAAFEPQSYLSQADLDILIAADKGTGVRSGCAVTAQGSPDMTVAVAAGVILSTSFAATVTSGNVTITAAHSTFGRKDLVVASSAGVKSAIAGTAAAVPLLPALPDGSVALAEVYVPAADTTINTNQITDKRVLLDPSLIIVRKSGVETVTNSATLQNDNDLFLTVAANEVWIVEAQILYGTTNGDTSCDIKIAWTVPAAAAFWWGTDNSNHADTWNTLTTAGTALVSTASQAYGTSGSTYSAAPGGIYVRGTYLGGANAGTLQLQWAQNTQTANSVEVGPNSVLICRRIA